MNVKTHTKDEIAKLCIRYDSLPYIVTSNDSLGSEIHHLITQVNGVHHNLVGGGTLSNFFPAPVDGVRTIHSREKKM